MLYQLLMENESINPFTGMENSKAIKLQLAWETHLSPENRSFSCFGDIEKKFKQSSLPRPDEFTSDVDSDFRIEYETMCPSGIPFMFEIKL